ncbi:MAG: Xaa-Pro aminopeptidase [Pseudomonadota bacterium]
MTAPHPAPITLEEYAARRHRLWEAMVPNSIAIVPAAVARIRNGDTEYPFCQDSDFYYLTGFEEPDAILVLVKETERAILFSMPSDEKTARWIGPRLGEKALQQGMDEWHALETWTTRLPLLMNNQSSVYYSMAVNHSLDHQVLKALKQVREKQRQVTYPFASFIELKPLIAALRVIKSEAELALMAYAASVSGQAHRAVMQACKPGAFEYTLEATFVSTCLAAGCRAMAYSPIVARGENACILHYTRNQDQLVDGALLLMDAGAEYAHYAADITRTFPINGRFSAEQRIVYDIVLAAQTAALSIIKPGLPWGDIQNTVVRSLVQGLLQAGIIAGSADEWINSKRYQAFYMHGSGHWLGLDVHDAGAYTEDGLSRLLQPRMVLTVEPGLYFSPECTEVEPRWRGIGIRIEDDVVVTETGYRCLSPDAPKTAEEIEAWMAKASC